MILLETAKADRPTQQKCAGRLATGLAVVIAFHVSVSGSGEPVSGNSSLPKSIRLKQIKPRHSRDRRAIYRSGATRKSAGAPN